jgi:WD40 repeat protein
LIGDSAGHEALGNTTSGQLILNFAPLPLDYYHLPEIQVYPETAVFLTWIKIQHHTNMTKTVRNIAPAPKPQATEARLTEKLVLEVHRNEVWEVCFSHDGTKLASSGAEKIAIIYDVDNAFSILNRLEGHGAGIAAVAWSPNDTKLVTCSQDFTAKMWDTEVSSVVVTSQNVFAQG